MYSASLRFVRVLAASILTAATLLVAPLRAQTVQPSLAVNRITAPIDENSLVTLSGTVHPLAKAANDRGAAADSMPLQRLHLVLKRSPAQEASLRQLINDMHTPGSASYHQWLTPEEFGAKFGPTDQDIATVKSWLASHGFQVSQVEPGKQVIEFSGNVAQLRDAFHASVHQYAVNGESHYANANDPRIPSALAPVVGGFVSLNNFRVKNHSRVMGKAIYNTQTHTAKPEWTYGEDDYPLAPADFAIQYDLNPLYDKSVKGSGETIAVINDSNINVYLVNQFRSLFGLSFNPPQVIIDGNDPGIDGINNPAGPNYDSLEAYLDVEWSGAVAQDATVDLVIGADTALEAGLFLAAEHAVYGNLAPVMSLSFGWCESGLGSVNSFLNTLWEQAAAQGITVAVSTGDNGSAGCDNDNTQYYAEGGLAVNGYASTPYNVAVGGTDFFYDDYSSGAPSASSFWSTTNNSSMGSLIAPLSEQPWNDSQYGLDAIDYYTSPYYGNYEATTIAAGSGGVSSSAICSTIYDDSGSCEGTLSGYAKPSWQSGTGVPADSFRDLPDVSLFAANGLNYSYYATCAQDGDCPATGSNFIQITGVGGTSASVQVFAGIMALVNQKYGPQGQADYVLYPLKAQVPAAFHDVTNGTNSVPCDDLYGLDCIDVSNPITVTDSINGQAEEGQMGTGTTPDYNAAAGYNLATGLGTIDANVLVTQWKQASSLTSTKTTLMASPISFTHGTSVTIDGSVTPNSGSGTPTGDVALMTDSATPLQQGGGFFTLGNGSFSGSTVFLPGGTYNIWARYGGDGIFTPSTSAPTQITVNPENSVTYLDIVDVVPPGSSSVAIPSGATNIPYGTQLILDAKPISSSTSAFSVPTGTVTFYDNGTAINTAVVNAEGDAEYNAPWSVGSHSVTAAYSGDASYNASNTNASPITFSMVQDTPAIIMSSAAQLCSDTCEGGQSTVFTIQIENSANNDNEQFFQNEILYSNPAAAPTGTVTVSSSPTDLFGVSTSAPLSAAVDPATGAPDGIATIVAPANTPANTYNVTISYGGDTNYAATNTSSPATVIIDEAGASGLVSTTNASYPPNSSISPVASIPVTGTVTGQSGQAAPTGTVQFFSSGYELGEVAISPGTGDSSSFSYVLNSQNLFQGANLITVQYSGDGTYAPSSTTIGPFSSPLSDFSIVPQTATVSVPPGGQKTDTVSVSWLNGFTGAITPLVCTVTPVASGVTCSVQSSVPFSSDGSTTIPVTLAASSSTVSGNYSVLLTATSGSFVHTLGIQVVVPKVALSVTPAVTAANKTYDGTTTATITSCTLTPPETNLGCSVAAANFAPANVGTGITVTATGITLTGTAAGNYSLSSTTATTTANITAAPVTASVAAANKVYNGTTAATITSCTPAPVIGTDVLTCSAAGPNNFATANVGTGITVTVTGINLGGTAAGNYSLSSTTATTTANITVLAVTSDVTAINKTYDGTTTATISACTLTPSESNLGCAVSAANFAAANVGTGITVTATGITLTGSAAGNCTLSSTSATTTANITPATVTASVTAADMVYDGNTTEPIANVTCTLTPSVSGLSCAGATATFATSAVGTGITVTVAGISLSGSAAGNYTLSSTTATTTANITAAATPIPAITSLAPPMVAAGSAAFTLTVTGTNFESNAVIDWNGAVLATTWMSGTQLSAAVPAADITTIGQAKITVVNPAMGAGAASATSTSLVFATDSNPSTAGMVTVTATTQSVSVQPGGTTTVPVTFGNASSNAVITASCVNLPAGASCAYANGTITITAGSTTPAGLYDIMIIFTTTQTVTTSASLGRAFVVAWSGIMGLPLGLLWMGGSRKKNLRRLLMVLIGMVLLLSLAGCGGKSATSSSTSTTPTSPTSSTSTVISQASVTVAMSVQ